MIPILYEKGSTTFTSRGLGPLPDALSCQITEERNSVYELEMTYPVTGLHYEGLQNGRVILARNAYCGNQAFDIYMISRPMNGVVTVNARHISYRLNTQVVLPCSGSSVVGALAAIETHILDGSDFTFWTDRTTAGNWETEAPQNVRAALGGTEGSILDVFGAGEYEWDNLIVKFHGSRGADNGVIIRYGKNLLDLVSEEDGGDVYTACVPFYKAQDGSVTVANKVTSDGWSADNDYTSVLDMSQYFTAPDGAAEDWHPTTDQMEAKALQLMETNKVYAIAQHLTVQFAILSQYSEFKQLEALERVNLCDYVTISHPTVGVEVKVKVIKTVWDVLLDRYSSIELGEPTSSLASTLVKDLNEKLAEIEEMAVDKTDLERAVENATALITGGQGGHIVIGRNANGEPNEIFIMDTDDQSTAVNVIRMNTNGIGFSTTGINGPYRNAWTIDGNLVADFITSGTLNAARIKAGILGDVAGLNFWNMVTGEFQLMAYAKTADVNTAIEEALSDLEEDLQEQIDGKIDTWYQSADPSTNWTSAEKTAHTGDLWYKTSDATTWRWNGTVWQEQEVADAVFDQIDGKSTIFYGTTSGTYSGVQTGDYLVDSTTGSTYRYTGSAWSKVTDYASAISSYDTSLNQQAVFNKLTNNGQLQGLYMQNGDLYMNGSYVKTGVLDASLIKTGRLQANNSNNFIDFDTGEMQLASTVSVKNGNTTSTLSNYISTVAADAASDEIDDYDSYLDQLEIYNRLTNNSANEGIYLSNGRLYVNASMINAGYLSANRISGGTLVSSDANQNFNLDLATGQTTMKKGSIQLGYNQTTGSYAFQVLDTGALTASNATLNGSLSAESGLYKTQVKDGYLYCYHDDDYIGKVGTSLYSNSKAMMYDIGYDADMGGIAVQNTANQAAEAVFYYDRSEDSFLCLRPIVGHGSAISFNVDDGYNDGMTITSDVDIALSALYGVSAAAGNHSLGVNGNGAFYDGAELATKNYVTGLGYWTSSAMQNWVQNQGYLTSADVSFNKISDSGSNTDIELNGLRWYYNGQYGAGQVSTDIIFVAPQVVNSSGQITSSKYVGIRVTNGIVRQIVSSATSSGAKNATTWNAPFTIN